MSFNTFFVKNSEIRLLEHYKMYGSIEKIDIDFYETSTSQSIKKLITSEYIFLRNILYLKHFLISLKIIEFIYG